MFPLQTHYKGQHVFALASEKFSEHSQTFVRQHGKLIAPDRTVFVSLETPRTPVLAGPHLYLGEKPAMIIDATSRRAVSRISQLRGPDHVVARFLREHGVTAMMAEFGGLGYQLLPAAQKAGCRYFVHFHGYDASKQIRKPKTVRRYQKLFKHAQGFFAPSQFLADKLIAIVCPDDLITITPCGVEPDAFQLSSRKPQRCLAVGRFVEKKAPHITIAAFLAATKDWPDAHLDFIGDGPLFEDCRQYVAEHALSDKVTLHGATPHQKVQELMQNASIFLQHSVTAADGDVEGLPVAILEAMSSGLAVVTTRHSGIPEAVEDGKHGILVDEYDAAAMETAIRTLLEDQQTVARLGDQARAQVNANFSATRSATLIRDKMGLEL